MIDPLLPAELRGDIVTLDALAAQPVCAAISAWRILRRRRRYPARSELAPFHLAPLLRNIVLVEIVGDGEDYEYCYVGESLEEGFNHNFTGRRLSAVIRSAPKFGLGLRMLYEMVRASGEPLGYRGWIGNDMPSAGFVYHEQAVLPLGPDETRVDHLMIASQILPRRSASA